MKRLFWLVMATLALIGMLGILQVPLKIELWRIIVGGIALASFNYCDRKGTGE